MSDHGEALIIENDGPTNDDLGRVVGQAVAQTLQHLRVNRPAATSTSSSTSTSTTTTTTQTSTDIPTATTGAQTPTRSNLKSEKNDKSKTNGNSACQKRPSTSLPSVSLSTKRRKINFEQLFKPDQLKMPIIEYILGDQNSNDAKQSKNKTTIAGSEKFLQELSKKLNDIVLEDFIKLSSKRL